MSEMIVEAYNPKWKDDFEELKKMLLVGSNTILHVEHTGSTAIVGMLAKPIIDIIAVISEKANFEQVENDLTKLGYKHCGNLGIIGREAFQHNHKIPHHLYVCREKAPELRRQLLFRDYLNTHPETRNEYQTIKEAILAKVGSDNRAGYVEMKATNYQHFFDKVLKLAKAEFNQN